MPVINTNVNALQAANALSGNSRVLAGTMQQLSTGSRVNSAKDDAAGLAIGSKMTSQIRGLDMAVRNANDGISLLQTAEAATSTMTDMLQRMRELAVQAANDTNASSDRTALNTEFQQLSKEIARIGNNTEWNGMNILNNTDVGADNTTSRTVKFQVGANANQTIDIELKSFTFGTGTAAVASEKLFNLAEAATDNLTNAKSFSFSLTNGTYVSTFTATVATAITGTAATAAGATAVADALSSAVTNTVGFENVSITAVGQTIDITDSQGRTISAMTAATSTGLANVATAAATSIVGGTLASGASAPGATDVFGGDATINDKNLTTLDDANTAITALDAAIASVNSERSTMGSVMNRLTYAADNLTNVSQNATESRSRVLDTDYAAATSKLAKSQIIAQAATAMLAQANQQPQTVLALLK